MHFGGAKVKGEGLLGGLSLMVVVVILLSLVALRMGCEFDPGWLIGLMH